MIRRGFTLAELLVALALLSVVVMMTGLLLGGMRNAADVLLGPAPDPVPPEFAMLEDDLLHLSRTGADAEDSFSLSPESGARWMRLKRDPEGGGESLEVHWPPVTEAGEWIRVTRRLLPEAVTTNVVLSGVSTVHWAVSEGRDWTSSWPVGDGVRPPGMVRVTVEDAGGARSGLFLIPAAMKTAEKQ